MTGSTLGEHIHKRILKPLGLKPNTRSFPLTREDLRERTVDINLADPEGHGLAVIVQWGHVNTDTDGCFGG
jgi:predicted RecB family endonuclease